MNLFTATAAAALRVLCSYSNRNYTTDMRRRRYEIHRAMDYLSSTLDTNGQLLQLAVNVGLLNETFVACCSNRDVKIVTRNVTDARSFVILGLSNLSAAVSNVIKMSRTSFNMMDFSTCMVIGTL